MEDETDGPPVGACQLITEIQTPLQTFEIFVLGTLMSRPISTPPKISDKSRNCAMGLFIGHTIKHLPVWLPKHSFIRHNNETVKVTLV